jgi:hypothetical protein
MRALVGQTGGGIIHFRGVTVFGTLEHSLRLREPLLGIRKGGFCARGLGQRLAQTLFERLTHLSKLRERIRRRRASQRRGHGRRDVPSGSGLRRFEHALENGRQIVEQIRRLGERRLGQVLK